VQPTCLPGARATEGSRRTALQACAVERACDADRSDFAASECLDATLMKADARREPKARHITSSSARMIMCVQE
jgi:hypothetical protein